MTMLAEKKALFAIPVIKVRIPEHAALKEQFLPEMLRRYEADDFEKPEFWETNRIHSSFSTPSKEAVIKSMPPPYEKLIREYVRADRFSAHVWHNVYWKNEEYQERHHHIPYHISLIHFLAFDRTEHKSPVFYDPARQIKAYAAHDAIPKDVFDDKAVIEVDEGDILIFPSYLEHRVPAGKYKNPRVTVSMNITLFTHTF
jgi:hypothetical protein